MVVVEVGEHDQAQVAAVQAQLPKCRGDHWLNSAGLAHLPSGNFMANAAWLALTVMAHNLGRAIGRLAGPDLDTATAATLHRKVFTIPGRLVHTARRRHLRLPKN